MTDAKPAAPDLTLFLCGPSKCKHNYDDEMVPVGDGGYTAICKKCGAKAIEEAMWE